ncbi:hypothetical protein [Bacillus oleivorans]|nr:hypothetical protein [Bacillus oleivorans]
MLLVFFTIFIIAAGHIEVVIAWAIMYVVLKFIFKKVDQREKEKRKVKELLESLEQEQKEKHQTLDYVINQRKRSIQYEIDSVKGEINKLEDVASYKKAYENTDHNKDTYIFRNRMLEEKKEKLRMLESKVSELENIQ